MMPLSIVHCRPNAEIMCAVMGEMRTEGTAKDGQNSCHVHAAESTVLHVQCAQLYRLRHALIAGAFLPICCLCAVGKVASTLKHALAC